MTRAARICALLAAVLGCWLALGGSSALAAHVNHSPEGGFDGADAPGGPFGLAFGLAADNSGGPGDGNVYVADVELVEGELATTTVHRFDEEGVYDGLTIDGSDTPDGSFSFNGAGLSGDGLAVDDSAGPNNGDLYVADGEHKVIDRFDEDGNFVCQITGRATPSASECNGLGGSATPEGEIVPLGIEVSPATGTLYVADPEHEAIYMFNSAGAYIGQIVDPHLERPSVVDIDSTGALYVLNQSFIFHESALKFDAAGNFISTFAGEMFTLTVDPANDHVYVALGFEGGIEEYDAAGNLLETIPTAGEAFHLSLAVGAATGRLYASRFDFAEPPRSSIDRYSPDTIVPDVVTGAATAVEETTATVHGEVSPDPAGGKVLSCRFEYGTDLYYHQSVPCSPGPPYESGTAVSADLTGLDPSTTYHFRVAAANGPLPPYTRAVRARGEDATFATFGPPTVADETASGIERTAATLAAQVNPHGFETEFRFEYVDDAHFQEQGGFAGPATKSTALSQIGDGGKALAVSQGVGGLALDTTYHFRAVATNVRGKGAGPGATFTTRAVAEIPQQWAYARLYSATAEAKINPIGFDTSCHVQYVDQAGFEAGGYASAATAPCAAPLVGSAETIARAQLEGLQFDTEYHFRFVATNQSGSAVGADQTFSTFGIESFEMEVLDEEGNDYTQAGGHPYEKIFRYRFNHTVVNNGTSLDAFVKDVLTEQPAGQSGIRSEAAKKCPGYKAEENACGPESQVGEATVEYIEGGGVTTTTKGLYDIVTPDGVANRYATLDPFTASDTSVRTGSDYGPTSNGRGLSEEAKVVGLTVSLWGVPADHVAGATKAAILRNPTACLGPQTARLRVNTWQDPSRYASATAPLPATTGCDKLEFDPSIEWRPSTGVADSPSGLKVDIHVPQNVEPDELANADLDDVRMNPAKGLIFNPPGAAGLVGCSAAQMGLHEETPSRCPEGSKIGRVEIVTSLLDHPLLGGIYMAQPHDNPFDSMFAIYLTVNDGKSGVSVKLAGEIKADAGDGQLTASFSDNPQLPIEDFKLDFFGGPRAVLRTPLACGTYVTESSLSPWSAPQSGPPAHPTDSYKIEAAPNGGACVGREADAPHQPTFRAGTVSPRAGAYSPFVIRLQREDGSQQIADLAVSPPPGLLGRLAGIPRCAETAIDAAAHRSGSAEKASPSCPASSQVGSVVVGAGAGPAPFYADGKVYVGGPYKGASLSIAVVVPVVAGPFDLGTVVVRSPLRIDLESGQVGVETDPLPTILEGVQLDVRSIEVKLDRRGFTVNPTSCRPDQTTATATSLAGRSAQLSSPFQLERCRKLGFDPKVRLRLLGKTQRRAHPGLRAVVTMPKGSANIGRVGVAMPPTLFLDNNNIRGICTRAQFSQRACPANSVYGQAKAWSPLLDKPLAGPLYMRSSQRGLPELVADLDGEFRLAVAGRINSDHGGIGAAIKGLPDVPVRKFVLTVRGESRGLLQNSVDVCAHPEHGRIEMEGQNGKVAILHPLLEGDCRKGGGRNR